MVPVTLAGIQSEISMKPSPNFSHQFPFFSRSTWLRSLLSAVSVALSGSVLMAAEDAEPNTTVPVDERQGSVWSVSDGDNTVYLAGSVHLLREADYPLSPVYDEVYADSEEVVMEIDLGEMMALALPQMKPGMIVLSISSLEAMRMSARPDLGLEMVFYQKARQDAKPVRGL